MASFFQYWLTLWLGSNSLIVYQLLRGQSISNLLWVLLGGLVVAACARTFYWLVLYPNYFTPFKHLPTPAHRSLLTGNETGFFRERKWSVARRLTETIPNNGLIRYYVALSHERLLITSPKALSEILVEKIDDYDHPEFIKFATMRVTGNGLQFATGNEHKMQRKNLMPAFSPVHIKKLIPTFWEETVKMVHGIEAELQKFRDPNHVVFLTGWSIRVALDIIGVAGMGYNFDSVGNPDNEHKELTEIYRNVMSRSTPIFPFIGLLLTYIGPSVLHYIPEKRNMVLTKAFRDVRERASGIIAARKEKLQMEQEGAISGGVGGGKDIITVALRSGMFSSENLLDHVMTSLVVGHISTSITFDWVMYELGQRPEMQARLRKEIRSKLPGGRMEDVDASEIETSLPYLNAVCSETLRFYPPLPYALRIAVRDTSILDTFVPKGTTIAYSAEAVNHDKSLWGPDANVFDPDRWMGPGRAASGGAVNNYAFLTFSAGPRNCIGQWWERAELACLVAATVGRFDIELINRDTAGIVEPVTAMMSREGMYARLKPLPGW